MASTAESIEKVETFTYTFDQIGDLGGQQKKRTVEIPQLFFGYVDLIEHTDEAYGDSWLIPHIDTTRFIETFINDASRRGRITSEQLYDLNVKYKAACKFILETKQDVRVVLGIEQWPRH
jgi:hypothetical protein